MKGDLYICSTYHHVMMAVIKTMRTKNPTDIVLCDDIPRLDMLQRSLLSNRCFRHVFIFFRDTSSAEELKALTGKVFFRHRRHRAIVERIFKVDLRRYDHLFIFHDGIELGQYLQDIRVPYYLIEDGLNHFQHIHLTPSRLFLPGKKPVIRFLKYHLNLGYQACGLNRFCISIEVNENNGLLIPSRKITVSPKEQLFRSLTDREKALLVKVFEGEPFKRPSRENSTLIITSPLYDDQYVKTQSQHIEVYRDIAAGLLSQGFEVYIKPHPRDNVDYSVFENTIVLSKDMPLEVFNFHENLFFRKAVSFPSAAIELLDCVAEKEVLPLAYLKRYPGYLNEWVLHGHEDEVLP